MHYRFKEKCQIHSYQGSIFLKIGCFKANRHSCSIKKKKVRGGQELEGNKWEVHYDILLVWGQWMLAAGYPPGILAQVQSWQTLLKERKNENKKWDCKIYKSLTDKLISTHYKCIIIFTHNHFKWILFITFNFQYWESSPHPLPQVF